MLNPPEIDDNSQLADWAELCLLFGKEKSISKSEFTTALEEDQQQGVEDTITTIWQEISWRKLVATSTYPVEIFDETIERKLGWKSSVCYSFLTLLSAQAFIPEIKIKPENWTSTSKLFERLTALALGTYVGETIIVGSPRNGDVPVDFEESVAFLCRKIGEERYPNPCSREHTKDDGLDVIAWRALDSRISKLIVLTQCAAGADWRNKTADLKMSIWEKYVDWPFTPIRAFAFPHIDNKEWRRLSVEGGLLFDRLRISALGEQRLRGELRKELKKWIEKRIPELPLIDQ